MDNGECRVCYENFDTDYMTCEECKQSLCLRCMLSLRTANCPFCRALYKDFEPLLSYSSSSSVSSHGHDEFISLNSDWNMSRIVRHQTKKLHKRQENEHQRERNIQISRSHNYKLSNKKEQKRRMQFEMEDT